MEYYFQTSLGLVTISPRDGLPSAVELRIAGKTWAPYLSAEDAARAVASSSTGHPLLDALPCACVPAFLSDWKQSLPHYFATGTPQPALAENLAPDQSPMELPEAEMPFSFLVGATD